jgi:hypothetical protein
MNSPVLDQDHARTIAEAGAAYCPTVTAVVEATQLEIASDWVSPTGSVLRGEVGDWLIRGEGSEWTVAATVFTATYEEVSPGTWRKVGIVHAIQVGSAVDVETPEGIAHADPGDWLVTSPASGTWPVTDDVFRQRYAPA